MRTPPLFRERPAASEDPDRLWYRPHSGPSAGCDRAFPSAGLMGFLLSPRGASRAYSRASSIPTLAGADGGLVGGTVFRDLPILGPPN